MTFSKRTHSSKRDRIQWTAIKKAALSGGLILDSCRQWLNLACMVLESHVPVTRWLNVAPKPGNDDSIAVKPDW